jgi:hypothetical protein
VKVAKTIDEALQQLKREPGEPVRAMVEGLTVEVREGETTVREP